MKSRQSQSEESLRRPAKESTQRLYSKPKTVGLFANHVPRSPAASLFQCKTERDLTTTLAVRWKQVVMRRCNFFDTLMLLLFSLQVRVYAVPNGETKQRAVVVFGGNMKQVWAVWIWVISLSIKRRCTWISTLGSSLLSLSHSPPPSLWQSLCSQKGALASTTETATTTRKIKNLIGRVRKRSVWHALANNPVPSTAKQQRCRYVTVLMTTWAYSRYLYLM